jgi:hypothetical protein
VGRPDLAMPAGMVCSAEARSSPVPGLRVDAAAARTKTFQGCLLRNRSQAQSRARGIGPLNLPSSGCAPRIRLDRSKQAASLNPNLTGLDWLRTYIKVMPTSALFLPDFGPSFPQAGAIFRLRDSERIERPATLSASSIGNRKGCRHMQSKNYELTIWRAALDKIRIALSFALGILSSMQLCTTRLGGAAFPGGCGSAECEPDQYLKASMA